MKRYPEHKGSGDCFGGGGVTWELTPLKKITTKIGSGATPRGGNNSYKTEGIALIRSLNVYDFEFSYEGLAFITEQQAAETTLARVIVEPKDILLNITGASVARCCIVPEHLLPARVNQHVSLVRVDPNRADPHYVMFCINSPVYKHQLLTLAQRGATREALTKEIIGNLKIPLPPLPTQRKIANFLNRKTEQINELIHIKERMVELLQEQRTALVHETVTKGLDPNVEMKPSGVEWIGEIPVHWEVKRLKYVAKILSSIVDKHIYPDEIQVRLCNYTDVYNNDYITIDTILEKGSCKESEFTRFVLQKDDVIITKDSETPDDIGVPTYVKDDLDNVVCGYHLTMIRPFACRGEFIFRFIQSDLTRRYFEFNANGITRYGLRNSIVENLFVPIPTDSEQTEIANFLDHKTAKIDELRSNEQRSLELLKEYRHTLISEVVTGKLDVRSEV